MRHLEPKTRAEIGNVSRRDQLLELARLLDRLTPDYSDPERFSCKRARLLTSFDDWHGASVIMGDDASAVSITHDSWGQGGYFDFWAGRPAGRPAGPSLN